MWRRLICTKIPTWRSGDVKQPSQMAKMIRFSAAVSLYFLLTSSVVLSENLKHRIMNEHLAGKINPLTTYKAQFEKGELGSTAVADGYVGSLVWKSLSRWTKLISLINLTRTSDGEEGEGEGIRRGGEERVRRWWKLSPIYSKCGWVWIRLEQKVLFAA